MTGPRAMRYLRLSAGADGRSRFEETAVDLAPGAESAELSAPVPVSGVVFLEMPPGFHRDWHPAPQRQFVIPLDGEMEIRPGEGAARRIGRGTVLLVEDIAGPGHVTTNVGPGPCRMLWLPLTGLSGASTAVGEGRSAAARYTRIYAGPDGQSHFEEVSVPLRPLASTTARSDPIPATGLVFRRTPADHHLDWHPAPRRQFVVTLAGEAEIVASDGEVRRFGAGGVMLAEDTRGRGHVTRTVGGNERLSLFVPLA